MNIQLYISMLTVADQDLTIWKSQIKKKKFRGGKNKNNKKFMSKILIFFLGKSLGAWWGQAPLAP